MVVQDTNVVSDLIRPSPSPAASLFFSAVGEAELRFSLATMPAGRRRDALASEIEAMLCEDFADRILPFDSEAARAYAVIAAQSPCCWLANRGGRLSDCSDRPLPRHGVGDPECQGF